MNEPDKEFYDRADAHVDLSNDQIPKIGAGKVCASMMYATARFNSWLAARGFSTGAEMRESRKENIDYFLEEYRKMLEENMDDYIDNFDTYMQKGSDA